MKQEAFNNVYKLRMESMWLCRDLIYTKKKKRKKFYELFELDNKVYYSQIAVQANIMARKLFKHLLTLPCNTTNSVFIDTVVSNILAGTIYKYRQNPNQSHNFENSFRACYKTSVAKMFKFLQVFALVAIAAALVRANFQFYHFSYVAWIVILFLVLLSTGRYILFNICNVRTHSLL